MVLSNIEKEFLANIDPYGVVSSRIWHLNRKCAAYSSQNSSYLCYYLTFRNITDAILWPVTMLPITVENDPNASLNMWNGKLMY